MPTSVSDMTAGHHPCGTFQNTPMSTSLGSSHPSREHPVLNTLGHHSLHPIHLQLSHQLFALWRTPGQPSLQPLQLQLSCQGTSYPEHLKTSHPESHLNATCPFRAPSMWRALKYPGLHTLNFSSSVKVVSVCRAPVPLICMHFSFSHLPGHPLRIKLRVLPAQTPHQLQLSTKVPLHRGP